MYAAGIYRPLYKPLPDFTHFVARAIEYRNRIHTVLAGAFDIGVMNN